MNQEMKNRLLRLNTEALVEMIEIVCGQVGMEFRFGQDPADCINNPVFYVDAGWNVGTFTVLNYDPVLHDKPKHNIDMDPALAHTVRIEGTEDNICDLLSEAISASSIGSYEIVGKPKPKEMPDNGCGCYQDPPCRGCKEESTQPPEEKMIDITPTWPEMIRIIAALMESGTDTGKRAAFDELKRMADAMTTYRIQRDEAIVHANNVVRSSSRLINARIPSGLCGEYWNAVDNFRRFECKTI